ncbi:hypothetical protein PF005_g18958 [Phytophthora fragariae]|uniref:Uncharacterized protein n=1 Tax=Phytophthora fragariae TaxID=53985 RepID=A0A6A4CS70_9STRA|nr:hypothetical protein PF009_g6838 [Phytophthora fragariae]KAE8989394.1 hypothetical protein PF011_g18790 [Phytophthora fragariae]KAE9087776.1 hypothetical protein PF007_g20239 [Phytophthora fragariae]KAE9091005.1 hypothetical protein PF010_g18364 [Phytophthora fragariae]KAE9111388.1 hypothetical protein PF006_g20225 [Phytophthora fragariae]
MTETLSLMADVCTAGASTSAAAPRIREPYSQAVESVADSNDCHANAYYYFIKCC